MSLSHDVFESIGQIPAEDWNAVAGDSLGVNHAMLQCLETHLQSSGRPRYFVARSGGKIVAVSVAVISGPAREISLVRAYFGRLSPFLKPLAPTLESALLCGRIPAPGPPILVRAGAERVLWLRYMLDCMEAYARSHRLQFYVAGIHGESQWLAEELRRRKYLEGTGLPVATLPVTWRDEDGYLDRLKIRRKNYATAARKEIERFHESGIRISAWDGRDSSELYALARQHREIRFGGSFPYGPGIFDDLHSRLSGHCVIYTAHRGATLVGVAVLLHRQQAGWVWMVGIDYAADDKSFTYFNLIFYNLCIDCPGLGIRDVYYGNTVQYAKFRRGCDILQTQFFVKPAASLLALVLRPIFALQRAVCRRKFRFDHAPGPDPRA